MMRDRFSKRATGWLPAVLTVVVIVVVLVGLITYIKSRRTPFGVEASVVSQQVVDVEGVCTWEIEVSVANSSDGKKILLAGRLEGIDQSRAGLSASIDPGETVTRVYRHELDDCSVDTATIDAGPMIVDVRVAGGNRTEEIEAVLSG